MDFKELFENSIIHKIIVNDLRVNMLNHSYMLVSSDNLLIKEYANFMAMTIMCTGENKPCYKCINCQKVLHHTHSDLVVLPHNDDEIILTDDINSVVEDSYILPYESDKKIYVLNDFDKATTQAQNKLLKTLEEPSKSVVFIITTSNENNVLPTIRSRAKKIYEPKLTDEIVGSWIESNGGKNHTDAMALAKRCFGEINTAYSYLHNNHSSGMIELSKDIFKNMSDSSVVLKYSYKMLQYKDYIEELLNQMIVTVREMMVDKTLNNVSEYNLDMYSNSALVGIIKKIELAITKERAQCNINSVIDGVLMDILEVRYTCLK